MTRTLVKGDLIAVAYNNYCHPAIYHGDEGYSTAQFYLINEYTVNAMKTGGNMRKDYINRHVRTTSSPFVKLNPAYLTQEQHDLYEEMKNLLIKNGKL